MEKRDRYYQEFVIEEVAFDDGDYTENAKQRVLQKIGYEFAQRYAKDTTTYCVEYEAYPRAWSTQQFQTKQEAVDFLSELSPRHNGRMVKKIRVEL